MLSSDYLQRHIDQLGKALGKLLADLLRLKNQGGTAIIMEDVQRALKAEIDLSMDEIAALDPENVVPFLTKEKKLGDDHIRLLADIFYEAIDNGDVAPEKVHSYRETCLMLCRHHQSNSKEFSLELSHRIASLQQAIND